MPRAAQLGLIEGRVAEDQTRLDSLRDRERGELLSGSSFGLRRSLPYQAGILVGLMSNLLVAGLGLAVVFTRMPTVGVVFRYASLAYVPYLATKLFRPAHSADGSLLPLRFVDGLVFNLINPNAYAGALAILDSDRSDYSSSISRSSFTRNARASGSSGQSSWYRSSSARAFG